MKTTIRKLFAVALLALGLPTAAFSANFILVNTDAPGIGFNDTTRATPVGGNAGTTVGEQRLIAYSRALKLWGSILKSDAPITVLGSFAPRTCTPTSGVLASAGAWNVFANFPNAPLANHWYHSALANSLAGVDFYPGDDLIDGADIVAAFNGNLGTPSCLTTSSWYYGLDNNANSAAGQIDFLDTFMHELAHGLGFSNFVNEATGNVLGAGTALAFPDVYTAFTRDNVTGKMWNQMSAAEIRAAAIRNGQEVWTGARVTSNAPSVLGPAIFLKLTLPAAVAGEYEFGTASFGATATPANFSGTIVVGLDEANAAGPEPFDACTPLTNAAAVSGRIALVRRGTCGFAVKAKNAQNAGAIGIIIANNGAATGGPIGLGGVDATVTIPAIGVSTLLGINFINANAPGAGGLAASATQLAGADINGRVRLYAPTTVALGSSISHFDTAADPSLLMEPFITSNLRSSLDVDLTTSLFQDIGWQTEMSVGGCGAGTGAPEGTGSGIYYAGPIFHCANNAKNHGQFQSCATHYLNSLKSAGIISGADKGTFNSCAAAGP
jgi:PA domain